MENWLEIMKDIVTVPQEAFTHPIALVSQPEQTIKEGADGWSMTLEGDRVVTCNLGGEWCDLCDESKNCDVKSKKGGSNG